MCPNQEEFKKDYIRWKRFVHAAGLEKKWMVERLQWLFIPQGLLFTAYAGLLTIVQKEILLPKYIFHALCVLGFLSATVVGLLVLAATIMYRKWVLGYRKIYNKYNSTTYKIEFTFGALPHWPAWFAGYLPLLIPISFMSAWVYIMVDMLLVKSHLGLLILCN